MSFRPTVPMLFREREVGIRSAKFAKRVTLIRRACIGALPASLASRPPTFLVACPACPDGFGQGVLGAVKLGDQSKAFVPRELRKNHANSERLIARAGPPARQSPVQVFRFRSKGLTKGVKLHWKYRVLHKEVNHRVLRKYLNQNSRNCEQFDLSKFRDLYKKRKFDVIPCILIIQGSRFYARSSRLA